MQKKTWIAVSATSVLGLGLLAGGATAAANAMSLTEGSTGATVPGLSDRPTELKGSGQSADVSFSVQSDSIVTPSPATPASPISPVSVQSVQSPVSVQTPASPVSVPSPVSPASPVSVASPVSPASPVSAQSPASVGSSD
ncbi:hypothetical protein [Microcella flavibacter]|uniref:hypothetical protein n=1 Tax=Microcella flavibacter TaxID=1804990 RepID=UPI0014568270|nr:hypothetical protein [Microcella flavibacter]